MSLARRPDERGWPPQAALRRSRAGPWQRGFSCMLSDSCLAFPARREAAAPAVAAPAPGEPMDLHTALKIVLKKAMANDGLCRGLHEVCRAIERGVAQLCVLAGNCNEADYVKLIEALCTQNNVNLITVPENKQLGEWCGLCKMDAEGNARKVRRGSARFLVGMLGAK